MRLGWLFGVLVAGTVWAAPLKVAAPGFSVVDLDPAKASFLLEYLAQAMASDELRIITEKEIATLLGVDRQKSLLGCTEESSSCIAELGAALGSEGVLLGQIAHFGKRYQYSIKVISSRDASVFASRAGKADSEEELVDQLAEVGKEMGDQLRERFNRPVPAAAVSASSSSSRGSKGWLIAAAGGAVLGVSGLGVMVYSGTTAKPLKEATVANPLDYATALGIRDSANNQATLGSLMLLAGTAALVTGVGLWFFGKSSSTGATGFLLKDGGGILVVGDLP